MKKQSLRSIVLAFLMFVLIIMILVFLVFLMTLIDVSYGPCVSYDSDWLAGWLAGLFGWLAGWLMLHQETRFKLSR